MNNLKCLTVQELIEALQKLDQSLEVRTEHSEGGYPSVVGAAKVRTSEGTFVELIWL